MGAVILALRSRSRFPHGLMTQLIATVDRPAG